MKIDTSSQISSKALYFPQKPEASFVKDFQIKNAIMNNRYISELAKKEDIFVRFMPKDSENTSHVLILDIVDIKHRLTKKAMWFSSRLYASKSTREIEPVDFINKIEKPEPPAKTFFGGLLQMISHPNQKYFNFNETSPYKVLAGKGNNALCKELKDAELTRYAYNQEAMRKINYTAKIIEMH